MLELLAPAGLPEAVTAPPRELTAPAGHPLLTSHPRGK